MLSAEIMERYADVLLWGLFTARTEKYAKGDVILVRFDLPALPVAEVVQKKVLEHGFHPVMRLMPTAGLERQFFSVADKIQAAFIPPGETELYKGIQGSIYLIAPESLTHLKNARPELLSAASLSRKPLRDILDRHEQEGSFGWTLGIVPTKALAAQAKTTLAAYSRQWRAACLLDDEDPVARWKEIFGKTQKLKAWLNELEIESLHIKSERCDLIVTPGKQRRWAGVSGHNIPSFEVFISPDFNGTSGVYHADQPSFRYGNYIKGVTLVFEKGRVTEATADEGEEFLKQQIAMDEGSCRLGEFSLTDRRFSRIDRFMANTLFDENFGGKFGNCHVALGSSYADTFAGDQALLTPALKKSLGFNDSALHWDLVNTEKKTVTATLTTGEKKIIYKNGQFAMNE